MEHCPVCNAGYAGGKCCRRCKTDFGLLMTAEQKASACLDLARNALKKNDYNKMQYFAGKSLAFKAGDEGKMLAGLFRS